MRVIVDSLVSSIGSSIEDRVQRKIFTLILFLIALLLVYVSVWVPLVNSLNTQIFKTKLMLMIIPLEILMLMKNVGKVLQSKNILQEKKIKSAKHSRRASMIHK